MPAGASVLRAVKTGVTDWASLSKRVCSFLEAAARAPIGQSLVAAALAAAAAGCGDHGQKNPVSSSPCVVLQRRYSAEHQMACGASKSTEAVVLQQDCSVSITIPEFGLIEGTAAPTAAPFPRLIDARVTLDQPNLCGLDSLRCAPTDDGLSLTWHCLIGRFSCPPCGSGVTSGDQVVFLKLTPN